MMLLLEGVVVVVVVGGSGVREGRAGLLGVGAGRRANSASSSERYGSSNGSSGNTCTRGRTRTVHV